METTQPTPPAGQPETDPKQPLQGRCGGEHDGGHYGYRRHRRGRVLFALVVGLAAGIAGGYIGKSFARGHEFRAAAGAFSADPAKQNERIERMVRHFAVETDASPAQQEKLNAIVKGAAGDLAPMRGKLLDARKQAVDLLKADSVDRAAIERLRAEQIQLADGMSRRVSTALADAAEVLTPQQRQKIAGRIEDLMQRGGRFGAWRGA